LILSLCLLPSRFHSSLTVQHINLLDLYARGYVRSIIIAFITEEGDKLMNNFPLFHQRMAKVRHVGGGVFSFLSLPFLPFFLPFSFFRD
jgi:hypothetical protein